MINQLFAVPAPSKEAIARREKLVAQVKLAMGDKYLNVPFRKVKS